MVEFPSERELLFLVNWVLLFQGGSTLVVEFPSERELLFLVNWGGNTLVVEFPSERELLFLVNWVLFVSGREHPSGGVSQ